MKSLAAVADEILEKCDLDPTICDIFNKWEVIVGPELAQYVTPNKIVKINGANILIVKSRNCCVTEVQHDSINIIDKVNQYFKTDYCAAVRVIQE